jgi:hypothetical protein
VGEPFAVVVVAVRDPLTSYLELIRALKLHVNEPTVLAVFSGGELPADLALVAAQIRSCISPTALLNWSNQRTYCFAHVDSRPLSLQLLMQGDQSLRQRLHLLR